ncbi:MAG: sulfotransferase [Pirellulaceae bacterium]|nr:sulfotransferase [Pirellulaceae bacterium]
MAKSEDAYRRPGWNQAGLWMGASATALLRYWSRHGFRIAPRFWFDAAIDGAFSTLNSAGGLLQRAFFASQWSSSLTSTDPLLVLGHWRTGTTLLHELLALDPQFVTPTTYQCFLPHHFLLSERWMKPLVGFALPGQRPPDAMRMGWDLPQEDEFALLLGGARSPYEMIGFPHLRERSLDALELDDLSDAEQRKWRRTFTRFLNGVCRGDGRLLLKSPTHSFRLPTIADLFPQAKCAFLVRDPYAVFTSSVRLWKSLFAVHGYQSPPDEEEVEQFVLQLFARLHARVRASQSSIASERFLVLRFEELVRDPVEQVGRLYADFEMDGFDQAARRIEQYFADRADYQPRSGELVEEKRAMVRDHWGDYFDCYGYEK